MRWNRLPVIIGFCLALAGTARSDVADEYEKYVDVAIRSSKEIARNDAYIRELAVFVDGASAAQAQLGMASDAAVHAGFYLSSLECLDTGSGKTAPNLEATVEQLFRTSQAINFTREVFRHLDADARIEKDLMTSDSGASRFAAYSVKNLGIVLLPPPEVGLFDGVYIVYASGGDGNSGGGVAAIPIIGSIVQIFKNNDQRNRLKDAAEKLKNNIARDADYQRFAREACEKIIAIHGKRTFEEHGRLIVQLRQMFGRVDIAKLEQRVEACKRVLAAYEQEVVKILSKRAQEWASSEYDAAKAKLDQQRLRSEIFDRVNLNCLRLQRLDYKAGATLADDIEADLALLVLDMADPHGIEEYVAKQKALLARWRLRTMGKNQ